MTLRMTRGSFLRSSATSSSSRSGGSGLPFTAWSTIFNMAENGRCPSTRASRSRTRRNAASSWREKLGANRITGPREATRPDHLQRDVGPHAEPDHGVAAEIGREPGRQARVVLDRVILQRWPSPVARQA